MELKETMKKAAALLMALLLLTGISRSLGAAAGDGQASPPNTLYRPREADMVLDAFELGYINNVLLVVTREGVTEEQLLALLPGENAKVVGRFPGLHQVQVQVKPRNKKGLQALADALMQQEEVRYAHLDLAAPLMGAGVDSLQTSEGPDDWGMYKELPKSQWWHQAIGWDRAQALLPQGGYVQAGVVDDGFDTAHPFLKLSFPNKEEEQINRPAGHGSHVAGIVQQLMPGATIRVLDSFRFPGVNIDTTVGTASMLVKNLVDMVASGARVINYSMGQDITQEADLKWNEEMAVTLSVYMRLLQEQGHRFLIVQSAGNGGLPLFHNGMFAMITPENCLGSEIVHGALGLADTLQEARQGVLDSIIQVGNAMQDRPGAPFYLSPDSNYGEAVTLAAPGYGIISSVPGGYEAQSGTSQAAPMVTAAAALVWTVNPGLRPGQVKDILVKSATTQVQDRNPGRGGGRASYPLLNLYEALKTAQAGAADK